MRSPMTCDPGGIRTPLTASSKVEETGEVAALRRWVAEQRARGRRIGFVPTMGYLHEGHLALVDAARQRAAAVVMSIFVNPLQFAPTEDLSRYPRDLPRDRSLAAARGVEFLFVPDADVMYPPGSETRVVPGPAAERAGSVVRNRLAAVAAGSSVPTRSAAHQSMAALSRCEAPRLLPCPAQRDNVRASARGASSPRKGPCPPHSR